MTRSERDLILTSLEFTRQKFEEYDYVEFMGERGREFRAERLNDVRSAMAAVRALPIEATAQQGEPAQ